MDGKHISMCPLRKSDSYYYNYKGFHSLVLLAFVDSNYKFIFVDVGADGVTSDTGIVMNSHEGRPGRQPNWIATTGATTWVGSPCFIVVDEAFTIKEYLQMPFAR